MASAKPSDGTAATREDPDYLSADEFSGLTGAMSLELVPVEQIGRWSGLLGLLRGVVAIPAPILGGLIWDSLGPAYVFIIPLAVDLLFKIPLLATIPETLRS